MKILTKAVQNIEILILTGDVSDRDVKALGAGIKKLMMAGKNRIILELSGVTTVNSDAIRAIGQLDMAARELAGRVLTCGGTPAVMKQIESFATPPIVALFKDLKSAVDEFQKSAKAVDEAKAPKAPAAPAPSSVAVAPKPEVAPEPAHVSAAAAWSKEGLTREEIIEREKAEVTQLRKSITDLETQNRTLTEQLRALVLGRKDFPTEGAYQEKIKALDQEIFELTKQLQQAPASKP